MGHVGNTRLLSKCILDMTILAPELSKFNSHSRRLYRWTLEPFSWLFLSGDGIPTGVRCIIPEEFKRKVKSLKRRLDAGTHRMQPGLHPEEDAGPADMILAAVVSYVN
jgi:hypothetical protein